MRHFLILLFLLQFWSIPSNSQTVESQKYIYIVPGEHYKAGGFHNFLFGKHWRDVWTTKIKVPVLNLDKFAGGLIPIKKGGGFQTKSLRLKGNDGHIWKFRSIEKDPSKALPQDLRESLADDILQDQISSSNPFAPFVVAPILDSVGILQSKPYLYFMPNSKKLGIFQSEFGGMLGIIEIHPDVKKKESIRFKNTDKVESTFKLFHRLEKHREEKVNSIEYLKARLIDLLIGDWDRHTDQWKWARETISGRKRWLPIPRDRDQAFAKFDGLLPALAEIIVPQFNNFGYSFQNAKYLTWNGRFVDRHFLTEITKSKWDSVTFFVKKKLTNSLIDSAVKKLPPEIFPIAGNEIAAKLKFRRDSLSCISNEFYNLINSVIDIYCTNKDDYVDVKRISNSKTSVSVFKINKKSRLKKGIPLYQKTFDNNITDEIRIYLLKGNDKVMLSGKVSQSPVVRIIGGKGKDVVTDNSEVTGYFLSVTPFKTEKDRCIVYDSGKNTVVNFGKGTIYDNEKVVVPKEDEQKYRPLQKNRGSENYKYPVVNYTTDDGFIIGAGILFFDYGFRAKPYKTKFNANVFYATKPKNAALHFGGGFNSIIKHATINLDLDASGLVFTKYYGYGNETAFSANLERDDFYKLEEKLFSISPSVQFHLSNYSNLNFGISYFYSKAELNNESLLNSFPNKRYGLGNFNLISLSAGFIFDSRNNISNANKGIYFKISEQFYPGAFSNEESFSKVSSDFRFYITAKPFLKTTFAFKSSAEKIFGKHPFFSSVFLGGSRNLLGYSRERFSGDASLFGMADVRTTFGNVKLLINGKLGFHIFGSAGRVFAENEESKKWHSSHGGGFWISYLNRALTIVTTLAHSAEANQFYVSFAFGF